MFQYIFQNIKFNELSENQEQEIDQEIMNFSIQLSQINEEERDQVSLVESKKSSFV